MEHGKFNCTGLLIVGHFYNHGGYAEYVHQIYRAAKLAKIPFRLLPSGEHKAEVVSEWKPVVDEHSTTNLGSNPTAIICDIPPRFRLFQRGSIKKCIGATIFETDSLPLGWTEYCNAMDEIWVPSQFNIETFMNAGVHEYLLKKFPLALQWDPANCDNQNSHNDQFTFLSIGSLHVRKGFDLLVNAYVNEFSADERVSLKLQTFPIRSGGMQSGDLNETNVLEKFLSNHQMQNLNKLPKIEVNNTYLPLEDLQCVMSNASSYVSLERANGWNLPLMQMIAMGKPTLSIGWGGSTEFLTQENCYLISHGELTKVEPKLAIQNEWYAGQNWPMVRVQEVQKGLRRLYQECVRGGDAEWDKASQDLRVKYNIKGQADLLKRLTRFAQSSYVNDIHHSYGISENPRKHDFRDVFNSAISHKERSTNITFSAVRMYEQCFERKIDIELKNSRSFLISDQTSGQNVIHINNPKLESINKTEDNHFLYDSYSSELIAINDISQTDGLLLVLSGGLTKEVNKRLEELGLLNVPMIYLGDGKLPNSLKKLQQIKFEDLYQKNWMRVVICDEDRQIARRTYQTVEALNADPKISYIRQPNALVCKYLSDDDIFAKSIFRRSDVGNQVAIKDFICIPSFKSQKEELETKLRISFFLQGRKCNVLYEEKWLKNEELQNLDHIEHYLINTYGYTYPTNSYLDFVKKKDIDEYFYLKNSCVLLWNSQDLTYEQREKLSYVDNLIVLDQNHDRMRSGYAGASLNYHSKSRNEISNLRKISKTNFENFMRKIQKRKVTSCAIFGTGPSINNAYEFEFTKPVKIICNTMVKNRTLLEHIVPDMIVASDADFHFGPSQYAQKFRSDLISAIKRFDAFFACPEAHLPILRHEIPKELHKKIIGIPVDGHRLNIDLTREFRLAALDNVLSQFLLPIAATCADSIFLLGFDGRAKTDTKFWAHNSTVQYRDLYDTVEASHPAFFHFRNYENYSENHSKNLTNLFEKIKAESKLIYSLHKSNIDIINNSYLLLKDSNLPPNLF